MSNKTIIETSSQKKERSRTPGTKKSNIRHRLLLKSLQTLQHLSPRLTSTIIWDHFTKTPRVRFNDKQKELIGRAEQKTISYQGFGLTVYKWLPASGPDSPRILLSHGWGSKIADFRRMIESLVNSGFVVEGIDMKGHGNSEGTHTALPEMRDVLKSYYSREAPFHAVIGYSIGGLAAGIALNELSSSIHPRHLFIIATPPYTRYFFRDMINQVGCKEQVYNQMCELVNKHYFEPIDYFDLRSKSGQLEDLDLHMIYEESDSSVPFAKAMELARVLSAHFVHVKGSDHNQIIADKKVIEYILDTVSMRQSYISHTV